MDVQIGYIKEKEQYGFYKTRKVFVLLFSMFRQISFRYYKVGITRYSVVFLNYFLRK